MRARRLVPKLAERFETLPEYPLAKIPAAQARAHSARARRDRPRRRRRRSRSAPGGFDALEKAAHEPSMSRYGFGLGLVRLSRGHLGVDGEAIRLSLRSAVRRSFRSSDPRRASHISRWRTSSRVAAPSFPSRATTRTRAARSSPAATPYRYRSARARTSSSISTRSRRTCCARTRILYLNYPNNPTAAIAPRRLSGASRRALPRAATSSSSTTTRIRELAYDGYVPPSIFEIDGARDVADRVPLALEDVQHDRLALRLGRGRSGDLRGPGEGQVVRRHRAVHGGPGGRGRRARELGRVRSAKRRRLQASAATRP